LGAGRNPVFTFDLTDVTLWAADGGVAAVPPGREPSGIPSDLRDVIPPGGDQYRDWFTRLCLYLVLKSGASVAACRGDTVVIGTEYGNTEAMASLLREAGTQGKLLSAQRFPNAISGSASAFVNMSIGATGRNMTLNGGRLTPVLALWQCLRALASGQSARCHLLIGDVYSPEALTDAASERADSPCRSAVLHAGFVAGNTFTADFDFSPSAAHVSPGAFQPRERNPAPATARFLREVQALGAFSGATLECRASLGRRASVAVARADTSPGAASAPSEAARL
jgi:hypothetical protein